jgi:hypothetical protein
MAFDRRRSLRQDCDLGALWRRGARSSIVRVRSLSVHGLRIDTGELAIEPNYLFDVQVLLPGGAVSLLAVARSAGPRWVGASIHAIDPGDERRLVDFYWSLRQPPLAERATHRSAG